MVSAILLLGGKGSRSGLSINKAFFHQFGKPLFLSPLLAIIDYPFSEIILVAAVDEIATVESYLAEYQVFDERIKIVSGGETRHQSVICGLKALPECDFIIFDSARPLLTIEDIKLIHQSLDGHVAATYYHKVTDCIKVTSPNLQTLNRDNLIATTTPQAFSSKAKEYIASDLPCFDEIQLLEEYGHQIALVEESHINPKYTVPSDFNDNFYRIGHSLDFHPFTDERKLVLGGITFDFPGLIGHSDADALLHAITESILGALALGDIGTHFPDTDPQYKNIDSGILLKRTCELMTGYKIVNLDAIVYLEVPKLKIHLQSMRENIANILGVKKHQISIKATTMEKKGPIGASQGIACEAFVLLQKI